MAEFDRASLETEPNTSSLPARAGLSPDRRPPQKKRVTKTRRTAAQIKADERRQIWEQDALLFIFFTFFVDA